MSAPPRRIPVRLALVLVLPGLLACGGDEPAPQSADPATTGANAATGRVDPQPFREQIQAVEAALYRREAASWGEYDRVGGQLMDLGAAVLRSSTEPRVRVCGQQLLAFGGELGGRGDVGYGRPHLPDLRRRWEGLRNEIFVPAAWFRGTAVGMNLAGQSALDPALDLAQTPAGPAPVSRRDHRRLERAVAHLAELCRTGPRECRDLGEPDYDISVPTAHSDRHVQRWQAWARQWDGRVRACWDDLPARPGFAAEAHWLQAWRSLETAARFLQEVPRGAGEWPVPFQAQWEQRFAAAQEQLEAARRALAEVPVS
jgi:hypothetical protein